MAFTTQDFVVILKKYPLVISCGVLSVVLLAGSYIRNARAGELSALLKEKDDQGTTILNNIKNGTNLPEQFETLSAATKELESRLVRGAERARNQQYFYRIESDTGVKELSLQANAPSRAQPRGPKPLYTGVSYTIAVQGDYRQVLNFIGRLESGSLFYRLISGSVSHQEVRSAAAKEPRGAPTINLTLTLELLGLP
jgi:hypothetical protein